MMALILILLANKADESFSSVPLTCTLVSEPCTGKSTVLRALNDLETNRFLSRQPRGSHPTSGSPNGSTTPTRPQNWAARRRGGRRHVVRAGMSCAPTTSPYPRKCGSTGSTPPERSSRQHQHRRTHPRVLSECAVGIGAVDLLDKPS